MYATVVGDPVRKGRLRISDLSPVERQISIVGLVVLFGMLLSVLLNGVWRHGPLTFVSDLGGRSTFVPQTLLGFTLIALCVAWVLILWGISVASLPVTVGGLVAYLLVNGTIGRPPTLQIGSSFVLRYGSNVGQVAFFAAPALVVVAAALRRWPALYRRVRPILLGGMALATAVFFGTLLLVHLSAVHEGITATIQIPNLLDSSLFDVSSLATPLLFAAAVVLVDFSFGVAEALAVPAWETSVRVAKGLLLGLIAVKLWVQLLPVSTWIHFLRTSPTDALRVVLSLAFFGLVAYLIRRIPVVPTAAEESKERLIYGAALLGSVPILLTTLLLTAAVFFLLQMGSRGLFRFFYNLLDGQISTYGPLVVGIAMLLGGVALMMWRGRTRRVDWEFGFGLALVGAWSIPAYLLDLVKYSPGFNDTFMDLVVTLGVLGYLVARWRRIDPDRAVRLAALLAFVWLATAKGDFIAILGGFLRLPAVVIVVFGVVFGLLADSAFASGTGRFFPRDSRPLLWIGYLVLSVTILNWLLASHGQDPAGRTVEAGFFFLGIPIGAWLLMRRPFETPGLVAAGAEETPILGELQEDELGAAEHLDVEAPPPNDGRRNGVAER
jgi:hypothetical protein